MARSICFRPSAPTGPQLLPPRRRYAIDPTLISTELGWQPRLAATVRWTLEQQGWCQRVRDRASYGGGRLGVLAEVR